ncbi:MAG TPA: hypothetical protein VEX38_00265, partial [Fimbriimonadaceae bacterium]|nr:hypothetical protein [Fimbriimonadaceae bacterium]
TSVTVQPSSTVEQVTANPSTVKGGTSTSGVVTLSSPAPSGGAVVPLSSSSSYVIVPSSVTVPAGSTSATFTIATKQVGGTYSRVIYASRNGVTRTAAVTLTP